MDEDIRKLMRRASRQKMRELWSRAKERDYDGLTDEDQRIAEIMLEHEDEFFNHFEFADLTYDREYDPKTESNPFLHIIIHSIVEAQLEQKNPIETTQFYNAMRKKKYPHHETIHFIGLVLSWLMFDVMKNERPFNSELYRKLLKKYKSRNPEKLSHLLEKDPLLSD